MTNRSFCHQEQFFESLGLPGDLNDIQGYNF